MKLPRISVVTCSYQQAEYLNQAMRSVLEQDYPSLEYIVIDGGSTDGSAQIIESHAGRLAYWVSESDRGQTDALIKGFSHATGDVLCWLCSDDLLLPGALRTVGEYFAAHANVKAAFGDALWIDGDGRYLRAKREARFNRFVFLFDHNYVPQPSMFWRRELYEDVCGLDPRFDLAMDADLWERFSALTGITHIPAYLSCMRFYEAQKTRSLRSRSIEEYHAIRRRAVPGAAAPTVALLRMTARCLRVADKMLAGGYAARVPVHQLRWLESASANGAVR